MKILAVLPLLMILSSWELVGCDSAPPVEPQVEIGHGDPDDVNGGEGVEMWKLIVKGGSVVTLYDEAEAWDYIEANKSQWGPQSECWHWTYDEGTWWVRHCGMSLDQECFFWASPTNTLEPCP